MGMIVKDILNWEGGRLQGILYDDSSIYIFYLVTLVLGGAAGYSTGKAIAQTWRPGWHLVLSALALGVAVRFLHHALFGASFLFGASLLFGASVLTPYYYVVDTLIVLLAGFIGFRLTRARQMTSRYRWLYRPSGVFGWTPRELS
jgi:hypothetical protein